MFQSDVMETRLVELIREARRILVFTGAGVSTGSGIRDFRGPQGVWKTREPVYFETFLASEEARVEYWDQKLEVWPTFRDARPNAAHEAIVLLERAGKVAMVVTQNIDGLHARAGTSRERLLELHGTGAQVECLSCHARTEPGPHMETFASTRRPPTCSCGGLLKPATISFGQGCARTTCTGRATPPRARTSSWPWAPPCPSTRRRRSPSPPPSAECPTSSSTAVPPSTTGTPR